MSEKFFAMGGYAAYVWSCYGLTLFALIAIAMSGRAVFQRELKAARRRALVGQSNAEGMSS
jgi:heme exporter protein CcmD